MSAETVDDGALVPVDPHDARVFAFEWDDNLIAGVTIATSTMQVIGVKPAPLAITSITRSGTTATATTPAAHGRSTGDVVTMAGAVQSEYNISATITVTSTTAFTFTVANSPTTPATTLDAITYSQGLTWDNASILTAAPDSSRSTEIRVLAAGPAYLGRTYEVANKVVTNESPQQIKERSFFVLIQNL